MGQAGRVTATSPRCGSTLGRRLAARRADGTARSLTGTSCRSSGTGRSTRSASRWLRSGWSNCAKGASTIDHGGSPTLRVDVRGTFTEDEEGNRVEGRTKSRKTRIVPIPRFVADKLEPLTVGKAGADYLFRTSTGTALNDHNWRYRVFGKAVRGASLGGLGLTPHSMRHTAASMAITAGADVLLVARMLGHANPSITLSVYSQLWPDRMALDPRNLADLGPFL